MKIAVTCATTTFGRQLTAALLAAPGGHGLILIDAEPHRLGEAVRRRADVRYGAEDDPLSLPAALAGANVLLVTGGPLGGSAARDVAAMLESARAAGVERIVLLSSIDPRPANPAPWAEADRATEAMVEASGLGWTILRLQESLEAFMVAGRRQQPGERIFDNRLDGRSAPVAFGDVVAATAAVLVDPATSGRIFELTGPRLIGAGDLARGLGASYTSHKVFKYFEQLLGEGLSREQAQRAVALGQAVRAGYYTVVSDDVSRLTGKAPLDLHDLLKNHIVVTGSPRFMRAVARVMASRGEANRCLLVHPDPQSLADLTGEGCAVRAGDLAQPASLAKALDGGVTLCLPGGGEGVIPAGQSRAVLDAARTAGIERVVLLSSTNADRAGNPAPWAAGDLAMETLVQASGLAWNVLRLQERLEDLVAFGRTQLDSGGLISNRGHGCSAPVALADAAAAACTVLFDHGRAGRFYNLTGPKLTSTGDLAAGLGLKELSDPNDRKLDKRLAERTPADVAAVQVPLGRAVRESVYAAVTDDVERLTGQRPADLHDFLNG
jgi:NAD(P)H dehydrogenase (quinone)